MEPVTLHATTVAVASATGWRGVLIEGPSGSGKSSLALGLMALGARLVADDRTILRRDGAGVTAHCPPQIAGKIEARGIGILAAEALEAAPVVLAVDLGTPEDARLPEPCNRDLLGLSIPLVRRNDNAHFCAMILQYLKAGRLA